jgi:hypothetical protein
MSCCQMHLITKLTINKACCVGKDCFKSASSKRIYNKLNIYIKMGKIIGIDLGTYKLLCFCNGR